MQKIYDFLLISSTIDIMSVIVNLILAGVVSQLIYVVFVKFGNTFSNRKQFGKLFFLITVCTTLIISVIQSSLALSLGLVGALSIVRFRTALKEPEELAYLFLCIAVGLGFGANLRGLTLIGGLIILLVLVIKGLLNRNNLNQDTFNFSVISSALSIDQILKTINKHTNSASLRRVDHEGSVVNAQLIVEFSSVQKLQDAIDELKKNDTGIVTSFISNSTFM